MSSKGAKYKTSSTEYIKDFCEKRIIEEKSSSSTLPKSISPTNIKTSTTTTTAAAATTSTMPINRKSLFEKFKYEPKFSSLSHDHNHNSLNEKFERLFNDDGYYDDDRANFDRLKARNFSSTATTSDGRGIATATGATTTTTMKKFLDHNCYDSENVFKLYIDCEHFNADEIDVKTIGYELIVICKHDERKIKNENHFISREIKHRFFLPADINLDKIVSFYRSDGILLVRGPKLISLTSKTGNEKIIPINMNSNHVNGAAAGKNFTDTATDP